jgi:hypothetical protein
MFGGWIYGKPYRLTPYVRSSGRRGGIADITFATSSGALLGRIRTDIERTLVHSLEFTIDEHGCADFKLTLNELPPWPLEPIMQVSVNVFNTQFNWFVGSIESAPDDSTGNTQYVYKGFGLRKELSLVNLEGEYSPPIDVGQIVNDIALNKIAPATSIKYNASLIETDTDTPVVSTNDLANAEIEKILKTYSDMANAYWGVNGDGEFYYYRRNNNILRTFWAGVSCESIEVEMQVDNVVYNTIVVKRQQGKGSGGAGWVVAAVRSDATSRARYGERVLNYQMPGYFSDADCEAVADALLAEHKDPKPYISISGIPIRSPDDYLRPGLYRIVMPVSTHRIIAQECDNAAQWTVNAPPSSDLSVTVDTDILVTGAGSLKLEWSNAATAQLRSSVNVKGTIKKVRLYARTTINSSTWLRFGIGYGSFTQHLFALPVNVANVWIPIEVDISSLGLSHINEVGIIIDDDAGTFRRVWIDSIQFDVVGSKHYIAELTKATYKFAPDGIMISSAEFGPPPRRVYDYVSALQQQANDAKMVGQIR